MLLSFLLVQKEPTRNAAVARKKDPRNRLRHDCGKQLCASLVHSELRFIAFINAFNLKRIIYKGQIFGSYILQPVRNPLLPILNSVLKDGPRKKMRQENVKAGV